MIRTLSTRAPAKINLGLRVVGRRPDGLHELESLLVPLDFGDELRLRITPGGSATVTLRDAGGSFEAPSVANLAALAARAFLAEARLEALVEIELAKHVPLGAGLGGGSSDAGAVLRGLASQAPEAVSPDRLAAVALSLGADVPFFLDPRPARVRGVGERIEPCPSLPELHLLLLNPGAPLSTGEVYDAFDAQAPGVAPPEAPTLATALASPEGLAALLHNDLEPAARKLRPELGQLRDRLGRLGPRAIGMSGSGATLFGIFESPQQAAAAHVQGRFEPPIWTRVARTLEAG